MSGVAQEATQRPIQAPATAPTGSKLLKMAAVIVPLAFLLVSLTNWVALARAPESGGFDGLVRRADFVSNLTGALIIRQGNGQHLYDLDVQHAAQQQVMAGYVALGPTDILPYNHLPFEAMLTAPLADLPYTAVFAVWDVFMLAALLLALWVMQRTLPVPRSALPFVALAFVSYMPVFRSFVLGQNSPLVLLGLCLVYAASRRKLDVWAGLALVLVALKPQILPVVALVLLLQGRWKALAAFAGAMSALCVAVMPVLGVRWPLEYARLLLGVADWKDAAAIDPAIMHNWRGFATDLLGGWAPGLVTPLFLALSLLSVALLVWAWLRTRGERQVGGQPLASFDMLWAVAGVVAVLTSLHLNPHDLTLLIFPGWLVAAYALSARWPQTSSRRWLALLWTAYLLLPLLAPVAQTAGQWALVLPSVTLLAIAAIYLTRQIEIPTPRRQDAKDAPRL